MSEENQTKPEASKSLVLEDYKAFVAERESLSDPPASFSDTQRQKQRLSELKPKYLGKKSTWRAKSKLIGGIEDLAERREFASVYNKLTEDIEQWIKDKEKSLQ